MDVVTLYLKGNSLYIFSSLKVKWHKMQISKIEPGNQFLR